MDNIINQDGSMPKIDAYEAGTIPANGQLWSERAGVGRVRTNKFGGKCAHCGEWIAPYAGLLTKVHNKFGVMHSERCVPLDQILAKRA